MLITDKNKLKEFNTPYRIWQGIPGIEVTPSGRIFSTFYSGGTKETVGNFVILSISDDGGESFSEPIAATFKEGGRCYDPVLWIDPLGRLWFIWSYGSVSEECGVFAAICDEPDAAELTWGEVFFIGRYVMMNKPTVLSTGEWLFPVAVWDPSAKNSALPSDLYGYAMEEQGAFVYKTTDNGRTFEKMGGVCAPRRSFDEHMVIELKDGRLLMLIRTLYGIAASYSCDRGNSWTDAVDSALGGPCSRFFIGRLSSGRILLINHYKFSGRNNLTALLSEDDGKTWGYSLLLDERNSVSYPDAVEADDGYIYITYDRERGALKKDLASAMSDAREILMARITEDDIISGRIVSEGGWLKRVISKLGEYEGDAALF